MKYLKTLTIMLFFVVSCNQVPESFVELTGTQTPAVTLTVVSSPIVPSSTTTFIPSPAEWLRFRGTVSRGQLFEQEISPDLVFRLKPLVHGWEIEIGHKTESENFSAVVTPPYYGMNARYVEGWHFRNRDNSGPNEPGEKLVNAPQEKRRFYFVLNEIDYQIAYNALNTRLLSSDEEKEQALEKRKGLEPREGMLTITHLELDNLIVGGKAWIDYMEFEVELNLPVILNN